MGTNRESPRCRANDGGVVARSIRGGGLALLAVLVSCASDPAGDSAKSAAAEYDHVVVFVPDDEFRRWLSGFLTPAAALETRHEGQGTRGRYFLLLDSFIELLSLEDEAEARANHAAFGSDYVERWSGDADVSPFAVGLTVATLEPADAPFDATLYASKDGAGRYLMARGNADLASPLIYATGRDRAYRRRESISEVEAIEDPVRREEVRLYLTHPAGIERLTRVVLTVPAGQGDNANARMIDAPGRAEVVEGDAHHLLLECDGGGSGRTMEFSGTPPVASRY